MRDLVVTTIDSAQGQEYDLTIQILTRAGPEVKDVTFLRIPNRLNVMASRPRWGTVLIANPSILQNPAVAAKKNKEYLYPLNLTFDGYQDRKHVKPLQRCPVSPSKIKPFWPNSSPGKEKS